MNKVFTDNGWKDYTYWQTEAKKTLNESEFCQFVEQIADNLEVFMDDGNASAE